MDQYVQLTARPDWESDRAFGLDVLSPQGRRIRVFIPKKMTRKVGEETYVSKWILDRKAEDLGEAMAQKFLDDFFDANETLTETPKVSGGNFPGVIALFDKANTSIKFPKLHFTVEGETVKARRAGDRSKTPGAIYLDNGAKWGDPTRLYFGRIDRDGSFTPGKDCPEGLPEMLKALDSDPDGTLRDHGKASGACCACGRELTEKKSVELGIGPVCRSKWI